MSSKVPYQNVGYGLTNALPTIFQPPIVAKRAPTTADLADIGATWIYPAVNTSWTLTSIVAGAATWVDNGGSGGTGVFASVEATTGNITADLGNFVATAGSATIHGNITSTTGNLVSTLGSVSAATTVTAGTGIIATTGNIAASAGNVSASGTVTAGTGINSSTGNIVASTGNIISSLGSITAATTVSGAGVVATGDTGGFATFTTLSNATNTTQSTGTLAIKSTTANPGNNAGFIKMYVGVTTVYVPYFTNIAP